MNAPTPILGPIGTVTQFNVARHGQPEQVRYFATAGRGFATGAARLTFAEAEADVHTWNAGGSPAYEKHAELPAGTTAAALAAKKLIPATT